MDEHRHKILVTLVFLTVILNRNPSIAHEQAQNLNKKGGKMERNEMKKNTYSVWFEIYVDLTIWTSSKQQCFLVATLIPRVAN
jgi:hypothetical protein